MDNGEDEEERGAESCRPGGIALIPRLLIACVLHILPPSARSRYLTEFSAELIDLSPARQVRHALRLLGKSPSLARELGLRQTASALYQRNLAGLTNIYTGLGQAARVAQPGDTLWDLTKLLHPDRVLSIEGPAAHAKLREAELVIATGSGAENANCLTKHAPHRVSGRGRFVAEPK